MTCRAEYSGDPSMSEDGMRERGGDSPNEAVTESVSGFICLLLINIINSEFHRQSGHHKSKSHLPVRFRRRKLSKSVSGGVRVARRRSGHRTLTCICLRLLYERGFRPHLRFISLLVFATLLAFIVVLHLQLACVATYTSSHVFFAW